jgi:hypothetical protein
MGIGWLTIPADKVHNTMTNQSPTNSIAAFLFANVEDHPADLVRTACEHFGLSRQAIHKHLASLIQSGALEATGATRARRYRRGQTWGWDELVDLADFSGEDRIWDAHMHKHIEDLPKNVFDIWYYGFGEMVNNVIDHSGASQVRLVIHQTPQETRLTIADEGIGIFRKIMAECGLEDDRHAVLELAKGKLTTDPERHTGQGIFFSSRMFDSFSILSGETLFSPSRAGKADMILPSENKVQGTTIQMTLSNTSSRVDTDVFDKHSSGEDYGFTKTSVPVKLAIYDKESLVSRSQAKRVLAGLDQFESVLFDFDGIEKIGQAFADEVFRVFANSHPDMQLSVANGAAQVVQMIARARAGRN